MSYTVLARRYRSATFDQIVGQDHIAQTLKRAIETGRLAHAFLFCGTRGTGKTSMARILAKALNCLKFDKATATPCGTCDSCVAIARGDDIDVIEIDAASNTGVDNVREIIENSQYRPARSRFKVYIIDEVHMLSKSAFNALLKTLEEPPEHVKFILATTEPEKVLPTILSRCQRYDFRNISARQIAGHLKEICQKEKIEADEDALALVARAGAGSMRDSLSLLDRLLSLGEKRLSAATVEQLLGLPRAQRITDLVKKIADADVGQTLSAADEMLSDGLSADALIVALSEHLRTLLIARVCGPDSSLLDIPGHTPADLVEQAKSFDPAILAQDIAILEELRRSLRQNPTGRALLDATLTRLTLAEQFASISDLLGGGGSPARPQAAKAPQAARAPTAPPSTPPTQKKTPEFSPAESQRDLPLPPQSTPPSPPQASAQPPLQPPPPSGGDETLWPRLLHALSASPSLTATLQTGRLTGIADNQVLITLPNGAATFVNQWNSTGKIKIISAALSDLRGEPTAVRFEVLQAVQAAVAAPIAAAATERSAASMASPAAISPEILADPLVQWVVAEFGGKPIREVE